MSKEHTVSFRNPAPNAVCLQNIDIRFAPIERGSGRALSALAVDAVSGVENVREQLIRERLIAEVTLRAAFVQRREYRHIHALRGRQGAEDLAFRATLAKAAVDFGAQFIKLITEFIGYFCDSCKGLFLNLHLEFRAYSSGLLIKCRSPRAQPPIIAGASGCRRCRLVQERKCCGNSD